MRLSKAYLRGTLCSVLVLTPATALAKGINVVDPSKVAERVCMDSALANEPNASSMQFDYEGRKWQRVSNERVAFYVVSELGIVASPAEALARAQAAEINKDEQEELSPATASFNEKLKLRMSLQEIAKNLVEYKPADELRVFGTDGRAFSSTPEALRDGIKPETMGFKPRDFDWFLAPQFTLACDIGKADAEEISGTSVTSTPEKAKTGNSIVKALEFRGEVSDLNVDRKARKTASAGTIGFERVREFKDDGTRTETETANIKAALGLVLAANEKRELPNVVAYVAYEQRTERTEDLPPAMVMDAEDANDDDDDTKLLQFGLSGSNIFQIDGYDTSIALNIQTAYLIDFTDDSERVRLKLETALYDFDGFGFLPSIGRYNNGLASNIWTRLDLEAIASFNRLTKRGELTDIGEETFGHIGGRVAFSLAVGETYSNGPFFTAEYLNLARLDGDPSFIPDISRHEFTLGNRWWLGDDLAIEVSAKLIDGENHDSFADENELSLNFGLIF